MQLIAIILAIVVLGILAVAAAKPSHFVIRREADIAAPPEKVFAFLNDFRRWREWSPWEKLDPELTRTMSGTEAGEGAIYEWSGNKKVGQGRMEITDTSPPTGVVIKLDFLKPFEAHNTAEFAIEPRDGGSHVTWSMRGPNPFMAKLMQVFMNFDRMVGKDFETGLANLKAITERG